MSATRSSKATVTGPDPSWKDLYRVGSISAFLATLLYIVATAVDFTVPAAPTSGGAATFEYIAEHRSVYILEQVLWLAPSVLLVVVFLALYVALKDLLFDTCFWLPRFMTGSAAKVMAGKLREKGILLIVPPESFFVKGKEGPLRSGELDQAAAWAQMLPVTDRGATVREEKISDGRYRR